MIYRGRVENGVVVVQGGVRLPEGAEVTIEPLATVDSGATPPGRSLYERLEKVVGSAEGLPADLAENHDQYLHGRTQP